MSGYIAYVIPDITRDRLLADPVFFPKYPDVFAHHVTIIPPTIYGKKDSKNGKYLYQEPKNQPTCITLYAMVDDNKGCQVVLVKVDDETIRPDGGIYHCTWSIDKSKGYKPVDSNKVLLGYEKVLLNKTINILTKPKIF